MKIDKISSPPIPTSPLNQQIEAHTSEKQSSVYKVQPETTITQNLMTDASERLAELPTIDGDKVSAIKEALSQGELELDITALTHAVMQFHRGHE